MIEKLGNLWTFPADVRIITTNGSVRRDGCAVMGRGVARDAATRYPSLPKTLGTLLTNLGNHVFDLRQAYGLMTFPVKHHWSQRADIPLIYQSMRELHDKIDPGQRYVMVRPGCGNGRLQWSDVRPLLERLPNNVIVLEYRP